MTARDLSVSTLWAVIDRIYFEPGGAQRTAEAVRSLFALARAEKQHKGTVVADLS